MKTFEYKTVLISGHGIFGKRIDRAKIDKELNKYGAEGWEVVASKIATKEWGIDKGILVVLKRCKSSQMLRKHVKLFDN